MEKIEAYSYMALLQGGVRCNDFDGDFSFEELRWAQMQAAKQGATSQTLSQEFNAAQHARQQAFAVSFS